VTSARIRIATADPQGSPALDLLRTAALEARALYPELQEPNAPWPTNPPTPARGTYVIAYDALLAVGMGALRSLDDRAAEVRRMYVLPSHRRHGVGRLILGELERRALDFGYRVLRLETGCRQQAALQL